MKDDLADPLRDDRSRGARSLLDEEDPLKNAQPAPPARHGPRRWPRVVAVFLLLAAVLVGFLPRLASIGPVRALVLAKVNAKLAPATLAVDDWSLRWFGPMKIVGVHFADAAKGADVQIVRITTSGGLAGMLPLGRINLGTITVDAPQARVRLPHAAAPAAEAETSPAPARKPPSLPATDFAVKLVVQGGRVEVATDDPTPFVLAHVALETELKSLRAPATLTFGAFVPWGDDAGRIAVSGSLPSPASLLGDGAATPERLDLTVTALDLQSFRSLLTSLAGQPWVRSGLADGRVQVNYRGRDAAQVLANLKIVKLSVEPPGKPVSPPGDVNVQAELAYGDGRLTINRFSCESPWVGMRANGQLALQPDANGRRLGGVDATLDADLAAVTRDFGSLLHLRDDFRAERGQLHVDAVLAGTADALEAKINLSTSNLALRANGELFVLQPAPTVRLNFSKPYGQPPEVRDLLVDLPFAHVAGKGRIDQADFRASVDLTAFTKEFRRVLTNCPVMVGTIEATLRTRPDGARIAVEAGASVDDLAAEVQPGRRLALQKGRLTASARVPLEQGGMPGREALDVNVAFESEAGTISASADRIVPPVSNRAPAVVGGKCRVELDLAAARRLAQPLAALPASAVVGGKLTASATAEAAGGAWKVRINAVGQDLQLTTTAWDVRERDVRVKVAADLDGAEGLLRVFDTHIAAQAATVDVPELEVQLPRAGAALAVRGGATGETSLAVLSAWRRPDPKSGPPPQMQGRVTFQVQGTGDAQGAGVTLRAGVDQFRVAVSTNKPFEEPHAELALRAALPADGSRVSLDSFSFTSSLGEITARGKVEDLKQSRLADLSGTLAVDFDNVNKLLRAQGIKNPVVGGRQSKPFSASGPLGGNPRQILSYGKASAALYLGSASLFGLTAGPADMSVNLATGVLRAAYAPALNQGRLNVTPVVEVTVDPMILSLPPKARVLQGVQLTQEMLDEALVLALPLLRGCSAAGGQVDLTMQECHVPLGPTLKRDMTFTAALGLRNVRLAPGGVLATVLSLAGHGGQEIAITSYDVTAECKDGRVKNSPLKFTSAGTTVTLSGSVGLDGSLAYTAEVPLSKGLVGNQAAKYLEGAVVHVPITGTIKAPAIDNKAVKSEIERLVRIALQKGAAASLGDMLNKLKR